MRRRVCGAPPPLAPPACLPASLIAQTCPLHRDEGFWVGKSSLRSWRQLALEQLNCLDEDTDRSNGKMNGDTKSKGGPSFCGSRSPIH